MKLQQLAIGDRFDYEGQTYVKTGPLTATTEAGGSRIIPRYAVLAPAGSAAARAPMPSGQLDRPAVIAAFERFAAIARQLAPEDRQAALDDARRQFLADLG